MTNSFFDFKWITNKQKDKIKRWLGIYVKIWKEFIILKYNIVWNENLSPKFPISEKMKNIEKLTPPHIIKDLKNLLTK